MDKLKENGFAVSVAVLVLGLLVLVYIWPLSNAMSISDTRGDLETVQRGLQRFVDADVKPSEDYREYLEGRNGDLQDALEEAKRFYEKKQADFEAPIPGALPGMSSGEFKAIRETAVQKLKRDYLGKFPRSEEDDADNPHADGEFPFTVEEIDVLDPASVALAQKHYWMIKEVFENLEAQKIGGLNSIKFRKADSSDLRTPDSYTPIRMKVDVAMPLSKLEPFLVGVLGSEQVPFIDVERIAISRLPGTTIAEAKETKTYKKHDEAEVDLPMLEAKPEPPVSIALTLTAMSWSGLKAEKTEDKTKS